MVTNIWAVGITCYHLVLPLWGIFDSVVSLFFDCSIMFFLFYAFNNEPMILWEISKGRKVRRLELYSNVPIFLKEHIYWDHLFLILMMIMALKHQLKYQDHATIKCPIVHHWIGKKFNVPLQLTFSYMQFHSCFSRFLVLMVCPLLYPDFVIISVMNTGSVTNHGEGIRRKEEFRIL